MNIFATSAHAYWNVGLPVIPLIKDMKRPAVSGWQIFGSQQPSEEEKAAWLRVYGDGNIGLPLGPASGLVAIDIDTDDPKVLAVLNRLLPPTPWRRVGKKGEVRIYRYNGEKTTRIQSSSEMICEVLSKGTQIVLPPSIHPDTKAPYTANADLFSVMDKITTLPGGIEDLLREALIDAGIQVGSANSNKVINFVPAGQRDNTMVWHAGLLARAVTRGERTLMEALGEMDHWVQNYIEQVVGDPLTSRKAQERMIQFVVRDVTGPRKLALPVGWDDCMTEKDKVDLGLSFTEDDEKWSCTRILNQLVEDFQKYETFDSEGFQTSINVALDRVSRSEGSISLIEEERILKFIGAQSGGTISMAVLRKQIKNLRRGDIEGENHNEIAVEVLKFISEFGEMRFHAGSFWQWKGSHWEVKGENDIMKIISAEFGFYPACRKTSDYSGILRLLRSTADKELNVIRTKGINFANGFLDEELVLRDHHEDYGCTYVLAYRYMPDEAEKMPMFNQFMIDSWGHDADFNDKVLAFQEAMGATVFCVATQYQKAICLFGQAGSGKSVASQLMRSLLPNNSVSSIPPEQWGDKFLPAGMFGKVMNFAGELSENKLLPGDILKQVTEGEQIVAQHKNQTPFEFRPYCAQWFNSNHLPRTKDTSGGFNRRWLFLEWTRSVPEDKRITDLAFKITDMEREAIAAWAVQGFVRLRKQNGYTLPTSHMALVDQMATDNNSVRYFLSSSPLIVVGKERVARQREKNITAQDLYSEYWQFCLATGVQRRVASNVFIRMMHELQHNFDFNVLNTKTNLGAQEVVFDGIALLGK